MRRASGTVAGIVIGLMMAAMTVVAVVLTGGLSLRNPFRTETTYHDQSALLVKLRNVSRYEAANGQFQVLVDVQRKTKYVPSWLSGDHTTFVAEGDVNAVVDFSRLGKGAVTTSADGKSATITLPQPTLGQPHIDVDKTHVMSEDQGLVNRFSEALSGNSSHDQALYQAANRKLARAASQSELLSRSKANTTTMLTGLLQSLGYRSVHVTFANPGATA
jgi:hypothetical protein